MSKKKITYWKSNNGEIPISQMEESHIKNTIVLLHSKQKAYDELNLGNYMYEGESANTWIKIMREELNMTMRKNKKEVEVVDEEKLRIVM